MFSKRDTLKNSVRLRRRKRLETSAFFLCGFLFIFVGLAALSQIDYFLIKNIKISGLRTIKQEEIVGLVVENISGRYFKLFPKNNMFLYDSGKMETLLKDHFTKIKEADIRHESNNAINIYIKEREASFMWCGEDNDRCYYMDENGLIFDTAPRFSNGVFLVFKGGVSSKGENINYIGKSIMTPENIKMMNIFKNRIEKIIFKHFKQNWKISSFSLVAGDDIFAHMDDEQGGEWELMIAPRTEEKYSFRGGDQSGGLLKEEKEGEWFGFGGDLQSAEANFDVTLGSQAFKEQLDNHDKNLAALEYIDLRFGKKVFYRFEN